MRPAMIDELFGRLRGHGDAEAVIWRGQTTSYAALLDQIEAFDRELEARGITAATRVLLEADFSPRAVALLLALLRRRAIVALATALPETKRAEYQQICQAEHRIHLDPGDAIAWQACPAPAPHAHFRELAGRGRPGLVIFSSGASGAPKASVHDAERLLAKFAQPRRTTRVVAFLLFDHIGGLNLLCYALFNRGAIIVADERSPDAVCAAIARHRADALTTTPTFLRLALLARAFERHDVSSLRFVNYSSEVMPQTTLDALHAALPEARLSQSYGLTEVGVLAVRSRSSDSLYVRLGGDADAGPKGEGDGDGYETRIRDGLLEIKARSAMLGYLNAPSPFTEDGWFRTGDAVERDGEFTRILGRTSELINVGGQKVYPAEVEGVLLEIPGVTEAVVTGEPHALTGQLVCAAVALSTDEPLASFALRMRKLARARLPSYMVPQKVVALDRQVHGARWKKLRQAPPAPTNVIAKDKLMDTATPFHTAVAKLLEIPTDQLASDTPLDRFETWDSLAMISVVALVTEHFGVAIPSEAVRKARCLADVLERVAQARPVTPALVARATAP
jgi:acyl-CoA synthetase (AMP-forming)/AMP-acid ligase II/acyl carrier protein